MIPFLTERVDNCLISVAKIVTSKATGRIKFTQFVKLSGKGKKVEIYESRVAGFDENVLFFFDGQMECAVKVNSDRRSNINFRLREF